jgi:hypothetical protein
MSVTAPTSNFLRRDFFGSLDHAVRRSTSSSSSPATATASTTSYHAHDRLCAALEMTLDDLRSEASLMRIAAPLAAAYGIEPHG